MTEEKEITIDEVNNAISITKTGDGGWTISASSNVCSMQILKEFISQLKKEFIDSEPQTKKDTLLTGAG